jgi:hypothetical protein
MSAAQFYDTKDKRSMFYLPLSEQAHDEFQQLSLQMNSNHLSLDIDIWAYEWGESFTSARYYKHIHASFMRCLLSSGFGIQLHDES